MPIFGDPVLRADEGKKFQEEKRIVDGPDVGELFNHLQHHHPTTFTFEDGSLVEAEVCSIARNHPDVDGRYYNDWIIRCEVYLSFRKFKAAYNSGTKKGIAGFEEID